MKEHAAMQIIKSAWKNQRILVATTGFEMKKRYSGSLLGTLWVGLFPLLFLGVYLLLYLVIFKVQYPTLNKLDSVIYIFSGLVPFIALMEVANGGSAAIKQNLHLIKNVVMPIELILLRVVSMSLLTQVVGLLMILALCVANMGWSAHWLLLPLALLVQMLFFTGLIFFVGPLGLMFPDTGYFISIFMLLLLFISPIGFMSMMLPAHLHFIVTYNPVYYLLAPFRMAFLPNEPLNISVLCISVALSVGLFLLGCTFFQRFRNVLADYE